MKKLRAIAVDDHPSVLTGLRHFLNAQADMKLVDEATTPEDAVRLARALRPDVAVLDLRLTDEVTGMETCREIKSLPDAPRVIVYSGHNAPGDVIGAALAGADGYLHKGADLAELPAMIRKVCAGEDVWTHEATPDEAVARAYEVAQKADLTGREWEVFTLMYRGYVNDRIAGALRISADTVKIHVRHVLKKLEAENRKELFG
ncbi:MAG: response regulator [Rubrobacteraceae bacterium]